MSAGTMLLTLAAILVYCGLLQRVLDRMGLTDRQALLIIAAMLIGTWLPNIQVGWLGINVGGAIIPLGICVHLLRKTDNPMEFIHAAIGTSVTAAGVYFLSAILPAEPENMIVDPIWLYGLCGGVLAWLFGRSRRNAFVCGTAGVILADLLSGAIVLLRGYQGEITLGGGGIADASVISGVMSVIICELLGESFERLARHFQKGTTVK